MKRDFYLNILSWCIVLLFILANPCEGHSKNEQYYFLTNAGKQVSINKIIRLTSDSVFIITAEAKDTCLLLDSISEYHHFKPGKGGTGFLMGAGSGLLVGGLIGALAYQPEDVSQSSGYNGIENSIGEGSSIATGGLIGFLIGGLTGWGIGSNLKINFNVDLRKYNRAEKNQVFHQFFASPE
jgi:hypothetical protein